MATDSPPLRPLVCERIDLAHCVSRLHELIVEERKGAFSLYNPNGRPGCRRTLSKFDRADPIEIAESSMPSTGEAFQQLAVRLCYTVFVRCPALAVFG